MTRRARKTHVQMIVIISEGKRCVLESSQIELGLASFTGFANLDHLNTSCLRFVILYTILRC